MATAKTKSAGEKTLVLLDVHAIIHRAYHALPEFATSKGLPTGALYGLSTMLLKIISDLKPDYIIACYDLPKPTYRHEAYKEYKAGRAKTDDALVSQLQKSYDIFKAFNIPVYSKEGFEADDMIGTIVALSKKEKDLHVVIASGDMDTLQLVEGERVRVYTLKKGIKDIIIYDETGVRERFGFGPELLPDYKGLRGDPSDNIIGIKGIGEKTATELITRFGTIEDIYTQLKKDEKPFRDAGITPRIIQILKDGEEEATFSKMLATIRPDAPIDFVLPKETWRESVDTETIKSVWNELEFRTLGTRLDDLLHGKNNNQSEQTTSGSSEVKDEPYAGDARFPELAVMAWLVHSDRTNPSPEEVYSITREKDANKAYDLLLGELKKRELIGVWEDIEKPLIPIITKMEHAGVKIDASALAELSKKYHTELTKLEQKIWNLAGGEFNVNSPKQLGEVLFIKLGLKAKNQKKTGAGALSTKESELEKIRDLHPIVPFIFEYREYQKLLSTYIDAIPPLLGTDGRLHAKFLQAGTTTGRLASAEPNLQNIPNHSELGRNIRRAFIADDGWKLVAIDYSQVELRIAAFLSGDKKLIDIFKQGDDVHTAVASEVFGVAPDAVDKEMRRRAKVINFGIMYGMGVLALKANLGSTREEAQTYLNEYFKTFSGLAAYLKQVKKDAEKKGYTETFFGRRRYFEGMKSKIPYVRAMAERMAVNAPIQGTEADFVKLAMVKVDAWIEREKLAGSVKLILNVHDELVYEVKNEYVEKVSPQIKKIMESLVSEKETLGVKILAEESVGDNWLEMQRV